jgi:serine/threonine-protein kinase RIM15
MIRGTKNVNQQTPIVAVTGYLKELPQTHHFDTLIEKPPTLEKLTEVLCQLCSWKAPPPDWHPGPQQHGPSSLRQESHINEDSPSSQSSGPFGRNPGASFRASSREDSIGSSSLFGDMEPDAAPNSGVIISGTDDWSNSGGGLGIEDALDLQNFSHPGLPHLLPFNSAPPVLDITLPSPRKVPSPEATRSAAGKTRPERPRQEGGESGDDEDDELGYTTVQPKSPRNRPRSSKLSTQMMRTNSRGSVISGEDMPGVVGMLRSGSNGSHTGEKLIPPSKLPAAALPLPIGVPMEKLVPPPTSSPTPPPRALALAPPPAKHAASTPEKGHGVTATDPPEVFSQGTQGETVQEVDMDATPKPLAPIGGRDDIDVTPTPRLGAIGGLRRGKAGEVEAEGATSPTPTGVGGVKMI